MTPSAGFDALLRWHAALRDIAPSVHARLLEERIIHSPRDESAIEDLRADVERIAKGMDSPQHPPPMLWSGIAPPSLDVEASCDYHLVISVGGTNTDFALLRLDKGRLIGFDFESGEEVASGEEIERVKNATRMATPVFGPRAPDGAAMVRQTVEHIARVLERRRDVLARCRGVLLAWGFAHRVVRTGPRVLGGVSGIVTQMTKDQGGFTPFLRGRDIGELFRAELAARLDGSPPITVANDTVMALFYFYAPQWRRRFHRIGLFINGTGTNFATAEPYAVRAAGVTSRPGEEYQPERVRPGRRAAAGESVAPYVVNYETGSIELIHTRTRFDTETEYPIERNALAGGNAFPRQLEKLARFAIGDAAWERARRAWAAAQGLSGDATPGAPAVGALAASDGSAAAAGAILGDGGLPAADAAAYGAIARAIVDRSALHAALVLAAVTRRIGYGAGGEGKPDLLGMEGSIWKIAGYADLVRGWWQLLAGDEPLAVELAHEPAYNASLPGPLFLAALADGSGGV